MEQVAAKQRIKVAAKDHVVISWLHFELHNRTIRKVFDILLIMAGILFIMAAPLVLRE